MECDDENPYGNVSTDDILYKTLLGGKPLGITFNKVCEFTKFYDGTRFSDILVLKSIVRLRIELDMLWN